MKSAVNLTCKPFEMEVCMKPLLRVVRCWSAILTVILVMTMSLGALAGDRPLLKSGTGGELRLFRGAVDTKGHFTVDATPMLPHLNLSLSLVLDFGFNQWVGVEADDKDIASFRRVCESGGSNCSWQPYTYKNAIYKRTMAETYISSVLSFNFGLWNYFVVGASIPLLLPAGKAYDYDAQSGEPEASGWSKKGLIGDIDLHVKFSLFRADRHAFGLGAVLAYLIPSGKNGRQYLAGAEGGGALHGKLVFDLEPSKWYRVALNAGAYVPFGASDKAYLHGDFASECQDDPTSSRKKQCSSDTNILQAQGDNALAAGSADRLLFNYGPQLTFGLGQSITFWPDVMDFVIEVYGNQVIPEFGNLAYMALEANAGIKLFIERNSYLMAGYAHGIPLGATSSGYGLFNVEHRAFIGFAFEPSPMDRDGDGIPDYADACPDEPEDFDRFEDSDGCPDPDNDKDGILDRDDECPLTPEDMDGVEDEDGCPDWDGSENDRDGDGIPDDQDACPDQPEDKDGFEDEDGCPDLDNDKDGILDKDDVCPNDPEDKDGFEDENGCPDLDNDMDRIPDSRDRCPNDPETYNGTDDEDGCPDQGDVVVTKTDIMVLKKIYFEYNSANIMKDSLPILDAVATTILNNPQIGAVEIEGHADERGSDQYNLRLTQQRAQAVKKYLIRKKVPARQLKSAGYGEYCPMDKAQTDEAFEKNRRVEFKIVTIDNKPTGTETGCADAKQRGIKAK